MSSHQSLGQFQAVSAIHGVAEKKPGPAVVTSAPNLLTTPLSTSSTTSLSTASQTASVNRIDRAEQAQASLDTSSQTVAGNAQREGVQLDISSKGNNSFDSLQQKSEEIAIVQASRSDLFNISRQLQKVREMTVSAGSDFEDNTQRLALEHQANALRNEVRKINASTQFAGKGLAEDTGLGDINSSSVTDINIGINAINLISLDFSSVQSAGNSLGVIDSTLDELQQKGDDLSVLEQQIQQDVERLTPDVAGSSSAAQDGVEEPAAIRDYLSELKVSSQDQSQDLVAAEANISQDFALNLISSQV